MTDTPQELAFQAFMHAVHEFGPTALGYRRSLVLYLTALLSNELVVDEAARAIWDWEHEGRRSQILDIEWVLLGEDYTERAQAAILAIKKQAGISEKEG